MISETASVLRRQLGNDFHRPHYHFLPPSNWMNDPNGVIQWKGRYHLFYQHNPHGPLWGDIHWGHAVSDNLIHWTDLPLALTPTPDSPDEAGCFSGCAVDHGGVLTVFYTGTQGERNEVQTQCFATSRDDLRTWEKYVGNPVLARVPEESGQTSDFRDPFVWKEDDVWYMVVGSRIKDVGGAVFLYHSRDLMNWEYLNPLLVGDIEHSGTIWECPNFFQLEDRWMLIISSHLGTTTGSVLYFVGTYENYHFTPTSEGVLDYGHLYAPLTMVDDHDRRVMFGWLREARSSVEQQRAGWSGVQAIPRVLGLDTNERLTMRPVPELEAIRGKHHHFGLSDVSHPINVDFTNLALDIEAEFAPTPAGNCGLCLVYLPNGEERTEIDYNMATKRIVVRKITREVNEAVTTHERDVPHELASGESLKLRVLLDGSVIEIIANNRTSLTSRMYPVRADGIRVHTLGTNVRLNTLDIWEMPSIWQ